MADSELIYEIDPRLLNPVGFHLYRLMTDPAIRLIICYGGSSSGKTYSVAQVVIMLTVIDGANTLVMRKVGASISKTIYEDFKAAAMQLGCHELFTFSDSLKRIRCNANGARIDFAGLDNPEKIKGISGYKRVVQDELSEFDLADFKQTRKRLRGRRGQQIIATFNPISSSHWIKSEVVDREQWHDIPMEIEIDGEAIPPELTRVKSLRMNAAKHMLNPRTGEIEEHAPDTVLIQSTYLNNFWVVGSPDGTYGYYDEQCVADFEKDRLADPDYYNVYALGEWGVIRTGSEYLASFNRGRHTAEVNYNPNLPIHISVDNNVLPYISFSYWQVEYGGGIRIAQIDETCAGNPDNTAVKAAALVAKRLREIGYDDKVYLHGDCTIRNANTIDPLKRSFLDLVISMLNADGFEVVDLVGKTNPNGAISGEFINQVLEGNIEGLSIVIGKNCNASIADYMSVQKDANGGIFKRRVRDKASGQAYEEHGHLTDTFRYVVCDVMASEFKEFSNRRKRNPYAREGAISYYAPGGDFKYEDDLAYCMPNVGGRGVIVRGSLCGEKWHIREACVMEADSTDAMKSRLLSLGCESVVFECAAAYYPFVSELRDAGLPVRVAVLAADIDSRIAATGDFVRTSVLFRKCDDEDYAEFLASLLDYSKGSERKEASAALSGFAQYAMKLR